MKDSASADWLSSAARLSPSCCSRNQKKTFFCLQRPTSLWNTSVCLSVWICLFSVISSLLQLFVHGSSHISYNTHTKEQNWEPCSPKETPTSWFPGNSLSITHRDTNTQEWSCWLFYKNSVHLWTKTSEPFCLLISSSPENPSDWLTLHTFS